MKQEQLIIGIMSGTSADAIDVAIVAFGNGRPKLKHFSESPIPEKLREPILRLAEPGIGEIDDLGNLDRRLGHAYTVAVEKALDEAGIKPEAISAIGCHGQTIRHRPKGIDNGEPFTLQIGDAATLAGRTGITTISDFRRADIAVGGEGAPLVPFAHRILFGESEENIALLNIGGIANITWLGANGSTLGFDTGPGNMVMDGVMLALSDARNRFDENGEIAASGHVCGPLLEKLLSHPYFKRRPPKSTGREEFGADVVDTILAWPDLTDADRLATAAELTAASIVDAVRFLPEPPAKWIVCGGGVHNRHLIQRLEALHKPAGVTSTDELGMPADAIEAASFAILARQTLLGEPNTIPDVTGAMRPSIGGAISPGTNWKELLKELPEWIR